jgi:hypothetical protein
MVLAVPVPANGVAGVDVTAAFWNAQVRDSAGFLVAPPLLTMVQTAVTSIPNNAWTALGFDTNTVDSYSGHSTTVNNSRYVAQVAGWVRACGSACFVANTTGIRGVRLAVNGTAINASAHYTDPTNAGAVTTIPTPTKNVFLNVGDYIEVHAIQTSGGALNTGIFTDGNASSLDLEFCHS